MIQLYIHTNVDNVQLIKTLKHDIKYYFNNHDFVGNFSHNVKRIGFMWNNKHQFIPFGDNLLVLNNYEYRWIRQEFYEFIKLFSNITIDLISVNLTHPNLILEILMIKNLLLNINININYSLKTTGCAIDPRWIMDNSNKSIKTKYFTNKIENISFNLYGNPYLHSAVILNNNIGVLFGNNSFGQLGIKEDNEYHFRYKYLNFNGSRLRNISNISCGGYHTAILLNDGKVLTCGNNDYGQLGHNNISLDYVKYQNNIILTDAISVSCGEYHTVALLTNGSIVTFGDNDSGQVGHDKKCPSIINTSHEVISMSTGSFHTVVLLKGNYVYGFGSNVFGQLGQSDYTNNIKGFFKYNSDLLDNVASVSCGSNYTAILLNNGCVLVCGNNNCGQLGTTKFKYTNELFYIRDENNHIIKNIANISCGYNHFAIILNSGKVLTCGNNNCGQLGYNNNKNNSVPKFIDSKFTSSNKIVSVFCGFSHTILLLNSGNIVSFGDNYYGQLGYDTLLNNLKYELFDHNNLSHPLNYKYSTQPKNVSFNNQVIKLSNLVIKRMDNYPHDDAKLLIKKNKQQKLNNLIMNDLKLDDLKNSNIVFLNDKNNTGKKYVVIMDKK